MARLSRQLLFTAEPNWPDRAEDTIFPRAVRPSIVRTLWLALLAMLVVLGIVMLAWRLGGV